MFRTTDEGERVHLFHEHLSHPLLAAKVLSKGRTLHGSSALKPHVSSASARSGTVPDPGASARGPEISFGLPIGATSLRSYSLTRCHREPKP